MNTETYGDSVERNRGAAALRHSGRLGELDELLTVAYRQVMDHPAAEARAFVALWFAPLHLEQGRPASAFRRASESYTLFQQLGRLSVVPLAYAVAAHALAITGRAEQASTTLAAFDVLAVPILTVYRTDLLQARAWTDAAAGDLPTARAKLEGGPTLAKRSATSSVPPARSTAWPAWATPARWLAA